MKTILSLLITLTLLSCEKQQQQKLTGTWQITTDRFENDIWTFTKDSFFISRDESIIWRESYSIPELDLSLRKDFNVWIFNKNFLTYELNSPYSSYYQHFMQGTARIDGDNLTWIPLAEPIHSLQLIRK